MLVTLQIEEFLKVFLPLQDVGRSTNFADKLSTNSGDIFQQAGCLINHSALMLISIMIWI